LCSLGGCAIVVEQSTEPLSSLNLVCIFDHLWVRNDQPTLRTLVIAFEVIMSHEFMNRLAQRCLAELDVAADVNVLT
jgi:hypothetical protein